MSLPPAARIALAELGRLAEVGVGLSGDAAFGLHVVEQLAHGSMGVLSHLMSHARTVRSALPSEMCVFVGYMVFDADVTRIEGTIL